MMDLFHALAAEPLMDALRRALAAISRLPSADQRLGFERLIALCAANDLARIETVFAQADGTTSLAIVLIPTPSFVALLLWLERQAEVRV